MSSVPSGSHQSVDSAHGVLIDAALLEQFNAPGHKSLVQCFVFPVLSLMSILQLQSDTTIGKLGVAGCVPLYLIAAASLHGTSFFNQEFSFSSFFRRFA